MWNERRLPRLQPEFYRGPAYVAWTYVVEDRKTGWLDDSFHATFREVLLHTCARYHLGCARYVLMPDHVHLICVGARQTSDQLKATRFLRLHLPIKWQKQAYDHVMNEAERTLGAFVDTCQYLRDNPVRASLVVSAKDWAYAGSLVPGFPDLDPWETAAFWRCFQAYQRSFEE
jgi:REP element-mobilizing transposase RayT